MKKKEDAKGEYDSENEGGEKEVELEGLEVKEGDREEDESEESD